VCHRADVALAWTPGTDHHWKDLVAPSRDGDGSTDAIPADSPYLLVYTSGTTGKRKGVVHTHCGFPVKTLLDLGICMEFKPTDRILWMSDMGWLVGPILVYGTTLKGGTMVLAEGMPDYPRSDRRRKQSPRHPGLSPGAYAVQSSMPLHRSSSGGTGCTASVVRVRSSSWDANRSSAARICAWWRGMPLRPAAPSQRNDAATDASPRPYRARCADSRLPPQRRSLRHTVRGPTIPLQGKPRDSLAR